MMNCQQFKIELEESNAPGVLSHLAQGHAQGCVNCRQWQGEQRRLLVLLSELERVSAPPDFDFRVRARLAAARTAPRFFSLSRLPGRALAAASLAAVLWAGWLGFTSLRPAETGGQSVAGNAGAPSRLAEALGLPSEEQLAAVDKPEPGDSPDAAGPPFQSGSRDAKDRATRNQSGRTKGPAQLRGLQQSDYSVTSARRVISGNPEGVRIEIGALPASIRVWLKSNNGDQRAVRLDSVIVGPATREANHAPATIAKDVVW